MDIKFSLFLNGYWGTIDTDTSKNFCYDCPQKHKTCFKDTFKAFETSGKEKEEGELPCSNSSCSHTWPYKITRI